MKTNPTPGDDRPLTVAQVGMHLDLEPFPVDALIARRPGFGRSAAAAQDDHTRVVIVEPAWEDAERQVGTVSCSFVRETGAPWIRLPGGRRVRRRPRRLFERLAALAPDVIHFQGLAYPRELRALAAALPDVPVLVQDHGSAVPRGWRRGWYRWGFARLAGVTFTTRDQAMPFVAAGVIRSSVPIFEVLVVSSLFTPGGLEAARAVTGLDGDPCLLWVGNLTARKDPLTMLDALAQAARHVPALRLHMCFQQAPLLAAVRSRIADDPLLRPRVRLLGALSHDAIEMHLQAADFLVLSSHAEGCGAAVLEALACGTTPLVTDIPSFRRLTGDGAYGALVPVGDAPGLALAIRDWSTRDRATLRREARAHFDRTLSFQVLGSELRRAYRAIRRPPGAT